MIGPDTERYKRFSPGMLAIEDSLRAAIEAGDQVYDFTIGDHPYKLQFGAEAVPLYEWHRAGSVLGRMALPVVALVREAKRALRPLLKPRKNVRSPAQASSEK